jgi:hypothetical protein
MNPQCGLIVQVIEDRFSHKLRLGRPDAQRISSAIHRDYHGLFGDPVQAYLIKHLFQLWRYSISVLDSPMPITDILGVSGETIYQELKEAHTHIRFLLHLLRPPRGAGRRKGQWWVWEHVSTPPPSLSSQIVLNMAFSLSLYRRSHSISTSTTCSSFSKILVTGLDTSTRTAMNKR